MTQPWIHPATEADALPPHNRDSVKPLTIGTDFVTLVTSIESGQPAHMRNLTRIYSGGLPNSICLACLARIRNGLIQHKVRQLHLENVSCLRYMVKLNN